MSAPILTCALLDAAGVILKEVQQSIKPARVHLSYFPPDGIVGRGFFNVVIHDDELGRCFSGNGSKPSRALMNANSDRQTFAEKLAATPTTGESA